MNKPLWKQDWDAIVVGTGMGGATFGYRLAASGMRVLFCEAGKSLLGSDALRGNFAEAFGNEPQALARSGRCAWRVDDASKKKLTTFRPFMGVGTGGSTSIYGGVLERFTAADFSPGAHFPNAVGSSVPQRWPIQLADLEPYYNEVEELFHVQQPPLTPAGRSLANHLRSRGHNPYVLPVALKRNTACGGCQGFLCADGCKMDATTACLQPALSTHGAALLAECRVLKIHATRGFATHITCERRGETFDIHAPLIVLAAGALQTPALLLRSATQAFPQGLANSSGMVGKNLMRHCVDLYAVKVPGDPEGLHTKELGLADFNTPHDKLGVVQSFGRLPAPELIAGELAEKVMGRFASTLGPAAQSILAPLIRQHVGGRMILASILEDLPYTENSVTPAAHHEGVTLKYRVSDHDRARAMRLRAHVKQALAPLSVRLLGQVDNNERIAHACGTARMGTDPHTSVVNAFGQSHDISNLYIADSSVFPSSGGTNPSLTIAANALRMADALALEWAGVSSRYASKGR